MWVGVASPLGYTHVIMFHKPSSLPQSTFKGRLRHFLDIVDPLTLLTSEVSLAECIHHFLLTLECAYWNQDMHTRTSGMLGDTVCLVLDMALPECGVVHE